VAAPVLKDGQADATRALNDQQGACEAKKT
jgi:hypothetical protein